MSEQGAAPETTGDGGGAPAAPAFDPAQIMSGFDELRTGLDGLRQEFTQARQPAEPDPDPEPDMSWLDQSDPDVDPAAQQAAMQAWQQQVLAQASAPAQQAMQAIREMQIAQEAQALVAEFPELGQQETAQNVVGAAQDFAEQTVSSLGLDQLGISPQLQQQIAERLGNSPAAWRMAYMASKADMAAQGEQDPSGATFIEGGTGPGPAHAQQDLGDSIVAAGGASVLPFR